jgi:hypothetical protein
MIRIATALSSAIVASADVPSGVLVRVAQSVRSHGDTALK